MGYRLDGQGLVPGGGKKFFSLYSIQTISRAHSASYPVGTKVSFPFLVQTSGLNCPISGAEFNKLN
jgi:hypothetical protein